MRAEKFFFFHKHNIMQLTRPLVSRLKQISSDSTFNEKRICVDLSQFKDELVFTLDTTINYFLLLSPYFSFNII